MTSKFSTENKVPPKHLVTFQPMGVRVSAQQGQTISEAAAERDLNLRSDCGGQGQCGQCLVELHPPDHASALTDNELDTVPPETIEKGGRLACEARILGPLSVSVADSVLDSGEAIGKNLAGAGISEERPHFRSTGTYKAGACGLAIDIGTTTLALYLCDLHTGEIVHSEAEANPQRRFGEDVISRIAYTQSDPEGLEELQRVVVMALNKLVDRCLRITDTDRAAVEKAIIVGNTTMQHLLTGTNPGRLGVSPYMPESCSSLQYQAVDLGLALDNDCPLYLFPVISGFVGGDTVGVIASERPHLRDEISLIIDIGTNGEVVLGNKESLWVTSCATGPALEGAHIQCGMRASSGAIEKVFIDPVSYRVHYKVIGNDQNLHPKGLCGSGIIDVVAEMVKAGLIVPSGRLREGVPGITVDERNIGREFIIAAGAGPAAADRVVLTLSDVRQVQLAKAALASGIKLLMKKSGIERFDRLVLTGAFGARFNWKNAVTIGMLPQAAGEAEVSTVENAAGRGAVRVLLDERLRNEIEVTSRQVHLVELAEQPEFAMIFARETAFPEV